MGFRFYASSWRAGRLFGLSTSELVVLLAIAEHANSSTGVCWPTQRLLASETRLSERTVGAAMRRLEALELIDRQHRGTAGGGRTSDVIRLRVLETEVVAELGGTEGETATAASLSGNSPQVETEAIAEEPVTEPLNEPEQRPPLTPPGGNDLQLINELEAALEDYRWVLASERRETFRSLAAAQMAEVEDQLDGLRETGIQTARWARRLGLFDETGSLA